MKKYTEYQNYITDEYSKDYRMEKGRMLLDEQSVLKYAEILNHSMSLLRPSSDEAFERKSEYLTLVPCGRGTDYGYALRDAWQIYMHIADAEMKNSAEYSKGTNEHLNNAITGYESSLGIYLNFIKENLVYREILNMSKDIEDYIDEIDVYGKEKFINSSAENASKKLHDFSKEIAGSENRSIMACYDGLKRVNYAFMLDDPIKSLYAQSKYFAENIQKGNIRRPSIFLENIKKNLRAASVIMEHDITFLKQAGQQKEVAEKAWMPAGPDDDIKRGRKKAEQQLRDVIEKIMDDDIPLI